MTAGETRQYGVVVLTSESRTTQAIRAALQPAENLSVVGTCNSIVALESLLNREAPSAALVDIDADPRGMLDELASVIVRHPGVRVVIISGELRHDLLMEAMQIGARHFLLKSAIGSELRDVLRRLLSAKYSGQAKKGQIVTVLSSSGGCGATTVAVSLADELRLAQPEGVLLVDLDLAYGAIADWLGLKGEYGIADVLSRHDSIDSHLVRSSSVAYAKGLDALLSPASINPYNGVAIDARRLDDAFVAFREAYKYTVIDAPRVSIDVATALAQASAATLIVMQLTVKDIHVARRMMSALTDRGVESDRIRLIVNRYHKRSAIGIEEARGALGGGDLTCLSNDFRSTMSAINFGRMLSDVAKASAFRKDVQRLAGEILQEDSSASITG